MENKLLYDVKKVRRKQNVNPVTVRNVKIGEGMPKICVSIIGKKKQEILASAYEIKKQKVDMAEWRVDWFEAVQDLEQVREILKELRNVLEEIPLLFTFRTKAEGGEAEISSEAYVALNKMAAGSGDVDLVDVELFSMQEVSEQLIYQIHEYGVMVVASNHDFEKTPKKNCIVERLCQMQEAGADILKIAVMPHDTKDLLELLAATEEINRMHAKRPVVTMSMSKVGVASRLLGEVFGSAITFGAIGEVSAPGQVDAKNLRNMLEMIHKYS